MKIIINEIFYHFVKKIIGNYLENKIFYYYLKLNNFEKKVNCKKNNNN